MSVRIPRIPSPSACRWCAIDEPEHAQRWTSDVGLHQWTPPTATQVKRRMRAPKEN